MIDKNELRIQFSSRLREALVRAGIREHGRGADILNILRRYGVEKTPQAVSKWLNQGAIPEVDSMTVLAKWLKVRREWLEHGVLPVTDDESTRRALESTASVDPHQPQVSYVPIISWAQAGLGIDQRNRATGDADEWITCPVSISSSGYALKVIGDSMANPGYGKTYPEGCIIFVDPELRAVSGDRVIARLTNTKDATFKVLVSDAGRSFLKPINPQYPIIEIDNKTDICGKIIGSFVPE